MTLSHPQPTAEQQNQHLSSSVLHLSSILSHRAALLDSNTAQKSHQDCFFLGKRLCHWVNLAPKGTPLCQGHTAIFKLHLWIGMERNVCCKEQSCANHFPLTINLAAPPSTSSVALTESLPAPRSLCTPCCTPGPVFAQKHHAWSALLFLFLLIGPKEQLKWSESRWIGCSCRFFLPDAEFSQIPSKAAETFHAELEKPWNFFTLKKWYFLSFLTKGELCPGSGGCRFFLV